MDSRGLDGGRRPIGSRRRVGAVGLLTGLLAGGVLAACGSDDPAPPAVAEAEAEAESADLPPGAEELEGRWAHYDEVAYEDETMKVIIVSRGIADLELRDGELWNTQRFCHADVVTDQPVGISFSDAATRAIVPVDTPVDVSQENGALRVVRPATPTPIGIDLEDPANESLPTDPDDPRIVDADGDGQPGVTATIELTEDLTGELYLARREIFAYDVTAQGPDRLEGFITDGSEQLVIGASNENLLSAAQWEQIDDRARNPVIWQRIPDDWDCDRIAAAGEELFPPLPEADW